MMRLTHGNECPLCGKKWKAEGDLVPNTKDREFYGGRVKFFKNVTCECKTKYTLCVGKKETPEGNIEYPVIDMIYTNTSEIEEPVKEKQSVLTTLVDNEVALEKLLMLTIDELKRECKKRKINFKVKDTKTALAKKLLEKDPNVVAAQQ